MDKEINSNECQIDISQLAIGSYFIKIKTKKETLTKQLIIE
ncbi:MULTISPECIES: T9SS type A sorting domain-containing protein [unclassified Lentimicrobium]|nr:T9SS type A sorting domain-containing protein [Lentimicrobium sp. S6]NPD84174.1 T9SS type A sorting domain-containing protein [Lentimicrobium sp. L6]